MGFGIIQVGLNATTGLVIDLTMYDKKRLKDSISSHHSIKYLTDMKWKVWLLLITLENNESERQSKSRISIEWDQLLISSNVR
jgi:uncharacterized ubiquitin-like protein YukD